jgi:hypothetical protein
LVKKAVSREWTDVWMQSGGDEILQPRLRVGGTGHVVDVEAFGCDRVDAPAGGERIAELGRSDAPRPPVTGLPVAETHQVQMAPRTENPTDGGDVACSGVVVEDVEEAAVDDGVECLSEGIDQVPGSQRRWSPSTSPPGTVRHIPRIRGSDDE